MKGKRIAALLERLEAIGRSLAAREGARALIGQGSVGVELERLDDFSDLDFFVIVAPGYQRRFLDNLDWLEQVAPIAYHFANTADGYKLLFADSIFCEFAVFEETALQTVAAAPGRIVWKAAGVSEAIARPSQKSGPDEPPATEWLLGEALTNLYVGLLRERRGEKLSAMRFIQGYAVDRILDLSARIETAQPVQEDWFSRERRYEQRFPGLARQLPRFIQGYRRNRESARAILTFLDEQFELNEAMKRAILALASPGG